jgi:hypothetical protein
MAHLCARGVHHSPKQGWYGNVYMSLYGKVLKGFRVKTSR